MPSPDASRRWLAHSLLMQHGVSLHELGIRQLAPYGSTEADRVNRDG
jgi:hypothetical protein